MIKFKLARPALLAVTVVRLNDCRQFGSFRVHAGKGLNRIPFGGRVNGRTLPSGTYRLLFHAPRTRDIRATATVMVIRGKPTAAKIRRVRQTNCSGTTTPTFVSFAFGTAGFPTSGAARATDRDSRSPLGALGHSVADKGESVVKRGESVVKRGEALGARFAARPEDPQAVSPFVLVVVGLLLLVSAGLGFLLALQAWRQLRPSRA